MTSRYRFLSCFISIEDKILSSTGLATLSESAVVVFRKDIFFVKSPEEFKEMPCLRL